MDLKHLTILNKWELEIKSIISEIIQSIVDLKTMLASTDINLVSAYKSKNAEFTRLSAKLKVSLPNFTSKTLTQNDFTINLVHCRQTALQQRKPNNQGVLHLNPCLVFNR